MTPDQARAELRELVEYKQRRGHLKALHRAKVKKALPYIPRAERSRWTRALEYGSYSPSAVGERTRAINTRLVELRQDQAQASGEKEVFISGQKAQKEVLSSGREVAIAVRQPTVSKRPVGLRPEDNPYSAYYVPPSQRKSYLIPESEKIQTTEYQGKIIGVTDPVARVSSGVSGGGYFRPEDIRREERRRQESKVPDRIKPETVKVKTETYFLGMKIDERVDEYPKTISIERPQGSVTKASDVQGIIPRARALVQRDIFSAEYRDQSYKRGRAFAISVGVGFSQYILDPIGSIKGTVSGIYSLATRPMESGRAIGTAIRSQPEVFVGEAVGSALFFKGVGKGISYLKSKVQKPKVSVRGSDITTERYTTKKQIVDYSKSRIQVKIGKKTYDLKGIGQETYIKVDKNKYLLKGTLKVSDIKTKRAININIRGTAIAEKGGGGYRIVSLAAVKGKRFIDITRTFEVTRDPAQMFRSVSSGFETTRGVYDIKPRDVSVGATKELFIRDIFTNKNLLRGQAVSESGRVLSIKQILTTGRLGTTDFSILRDTTGVRDFSRTIASRSVQGSSLASSSVTSNIKVANLPILSQKSLITQISKSGILATLTEKVGISTSGAVGVTSSVVQGAGLKSMTATDQVVRVKSKQKPMQYSIIKPVQEVKVTQKPKPIQREFPIIKQQPISSQSLRSINIQSLGQIQSQSVTQVQSVRQEIEPITVQDTIGAFRGGVDTTSSVPPPPDIPVPIINNPFGKSFNRREDILKRRRSSGSFFDLKLPSVEAVTFNIKKKRSRIPERVYRTGLELRPIGV